MRLATLLGLYVVLTSGGLLFLRHALDDARHPGESLVERLLAPATAVGGLLYAASFAVWLVALQRYPVTTVYPVFVGAGFLGVALGGWLLLGEGFGVGRAVGVLVVLAGIALLVR